MMMLAKAKPNSAPALVLCTKCETPMEVLAKSNPGPIDRLMAFQFKRGCVDLWKYRKMPLEKRECLIFPQNSF